MPTPGGQSVDGAAVLQKAFEIASCHLQDSEKFTITNALSPEEVLAQFPEASQLEEGPSGSMAQVVAMMEKTLKLSVNTSSKRFCNQLYAEPDAVGLAASLLTSVSNCSLATYEMSPLYSMCERELVAKLLHRVGFDPATGEGIFCPGGSHCNHTAMVVARNKFEPQSKTVGMTAAAGDAGALVGFASADCHYSIQKGANLIGIGQSSDGGLVCVPTDASGAMSVEALRTAVAKARAEGKRPFLVVATAGTTVRGAFDPIDAIADVCEEFGMWLHVDGALGASVILSSQQKHRVAGLSRADSLTWDAHKMLGVPLQCAVLLLRNKSLKESNSATGAYLFKTHTLQQLADSQGDPLGTIKRELSEQAMNSGESSLQCGRLADSFKWWAMWYVHGEQWFRNRVDQLEILRNHFISKVRASHTLHFAAAPEGLNVLFYALPQHLLSPEGEPNLSNDDTRAKVALASQVVRRKLLEEGKWMVNYQQTGGAAAPCFRMVFLNPALTVSDLDELIADIVSLVSKYLANDSTTWTGDSSEVRLRRPTTTKSVTSAPARFQQLMDAVDHFAKENPKSPAASDSQGTLTYEELATLSTTLASRMSSPPGTVVPIWVRRGRLAVVAMAAALRRGCAWLMIDETLPTGRVQYLLQESRGVELLADESVPASVLPSGMKSVCISLEQLEAAPRVAWSATRPTEAEPYAYQIFTSGTTGLPKSVMITQRQLMRLCDVFRDEFPLRLKPGDVCMALIAYAWDMHTLDMWVPLLQGACTHILSEAERLDGSRVADLMAELRPRFCQATPTLYKAVLKAGWDGDGTVDSLTALSSGEPMTKALAKQLLHRCRSLVNFYGLTEATIFQCFEVLRLDDEGEVDINCGSFCYPESYGRMYILDEKHQPVSEGEVGQVAFAGALLPRSAYINAPEVNSAKFIQNPTGWICEEVSDALRREKVLLVGDQGYIRKDGKLIVCGRMDDMVKVHGSRVDVHEVEEAMRRCCSDLVADSVVVPAQRRGETVLAAYWQPTSAAKTLAAAPQEEAEDDEVGLWADIYDEAYAKKDAESMQKEFAAMSPEDMITNWSAYISSYTGVLWPRAVIEYWVNATVDRFLDHGPKRILEHGCGNGMLLYRAALQPNVEEVWGCDLSGEAVAYLEQVKRAPQFQHIASKIHALHRPADNFDGVPDNHFDLIVMSAMIMYFPSMAYVSDVLRKCSKALRDGGVVYIGDCRSLEHQQLFHTDVTLFNAADDLSVGELLQRCRDRNAKEKELLISPAYFYAHDRLLPGCFDHVVCALRRGYDCPEGQPVQPGAPVEMTRWRYDVWLYKGAAGDAVSEAAAPVTKSSYVSSVTIDDAIAAAQRGQATVVTGIPNPRVLDAYAVEELIRGGSSDRSVRELREEIRAWREQLAPALCPEVLLERCEALSGVYVQTMFSRGALQTYDAVFRPLGKSMTPVRSPAGRTGELSSFTDWGRNLVDMPRELEWGRIMGQLEAPVYDLEGYGNKRRFEKLHTDMMSSLARELPRPMIPQMLVPVDTFPMTSTGKKDKKRLPAIVFTKERTTEFVETSSSMEKTVGAMWRSLFAVERIGALDKWDELGGHSLLAGRLIAMIRDEVGVDCVMQDVFDNNTPRALAKLLESKAPSQQIAKAKPSASEKTTKALAFEVAVEDLSIPVDDVKLAARSWKPSADQNTGPMTVVVDFAPYPFTHMTATADAMIFPQLVELGAGKTCALRVAARGFDDSEGTCSDPYDLRSQVEDYLAVLRWVEKQPWCDGNIILHGFSWAGTACLRVASNDLCPSSVKAICICAGNDDLYDGDVFFQGGVPLTSSYSWAMQFMMYMTRPPTTPASSQVWLERGNALKEDLAAKYLGANDANAEYWASQSLQGQYSKLKCPVLCASGYFGGYTDAVMRLTQGVRHVRVRGLVGPWTHQFPHLSTSGPGADWVAEVHAWINQASLDATPTSELCAYVLDQAVKGPGIPSSIPGQWMRIGEVGSVDKCNGCVGPSTASAQLSVELAGPFDVEAAAVPCGAASGEWFSWGMGADFAGDQQQDDLLATCFEQAPAKEEVTIVGAPLFRAKLEDQNFEGMLLVRLLDVAPDGSSRRLSWGVSSLKRGSDEVAIPMRFVAAKVPAGHRLRVGLSLDYFPMFFPNPSKGDADRRLRLTQAKLSVHSETLQPYEMPPPRTYTATSAMALRRLRQPRQSFESFGLKFNTVHDDGAVEVETQAGPVRVTTRSEMNATIDAETREAVVKVSGRTAVHDLKAGGLRATTISGELRTHVQDAGAFGRAEDVPAATLQLVLEMREDARVLKRRVFNSTVRSLLPMTSV